MELIRSSTWRKLGEHPQQWILGACIAVLVWLIGGELWLAVRALGYSPPNTAPAATASVDPDPGREREREVPPAGGYAVAPVLLR